MQQECVRAQSISMDAALYRDCQSIAGWQRGENEHISGKLMLSVLAGFVRPKRSGVVGENIKEAVEVGDVIEALIRGERQVPYRNHKLTRLLQDSLSGIDETLMEGRDRAA